MKQWMYAGAMLCAVAMMTGCSQEELEGGWAQSVDFELNAVVGSDTRTSVDGSYNVNWSIGDAIYVYGTGASGTLSLTSGAGQTTATFGGTMTGNKSDLQYAVYPASSFSKSEMKVTLPANYELPNITVR